MLVDWLSAGSDYSFNNLLDTNRVSKANSIFFLHGFTVFVEKTDLFLRVAVKQSKQERE